MSVFILQCFSECVTLSWVFLLHFSVSVVSLFSLIGNVFPSVLLCYPNLFPLNRLMTFEQRYTTVAFIYFNLHIKVDIEPKSKFLIFFLSKCVVLFSKMYQKYVPPGFIHVTGCAISPEFYNVHRNVQVCHRIRVCLVHFLVVIDILFVMSLEYYVIFKNYVSYKYYVIHKNRIVNEKRRFKICQLQ